MPFTSSVTIPTSIQTATRSIPFSQTKGPIYPQGKRTLLSLVKNFRKVFPNSDFKNLKILQSSERDYGLNKLFLGVCQARDGKHSYKVAIRVHRKNKNEHYSINSYCEVRCSCPAFHYWTAYPDVRSKNFYGRPSYWNKVRNRVRNPRLVPSICKHVFTYASYLIQFGYIAKR